MGYTPDSDPGTAAAGGSLPPDATGMIGHLSALFIETKETNRLLSELLLLLSDAGAPKES